MRRVEPCHHGAGRLRGVEAVRAADTVARLEESGARDHVRSIASCWATEVVALPGCGLRALVTVAIFGAGGRSALVSASVRQADWPSLWLSLRGLWSLAGRQDRSRLARRSATAAASAPSRRFVPCQGRWHGSTRTRDRATARRSAGSPRDTRRVPVAVAVDQLASRVVGVRVTARGVKHLDETHWRHRAARPASAACQIVRPTPVLAVAESQAVTANATHCGGCESHHDEAHSDRVCVSMATRPRTEPRSAQ